MDVKTEDRRHGTARVRDRGYVGRWAALCLTLGALGLVVWPLPAVACSLAGVASISANGVLAVLTTDAPTKTATSTWAPFTFGLAFAPGATVRLVEDLGKVQRSLPAGALKSPLRWSFSDGRRARGMSTVHDYARPGWYRVGVRAYLPAPHRWLDVDSVRVHIVPTAGLLQANIGYLVVLGLGWFTRFLAYGGFALSIIVPVVWHLHRRMRRSPSTTRARTVTG